MRRQLVLPAAALALAGCGGGSSQPAVGTMLKESLTKRGLSVRAAVCTRRPERIGGAPVYRCNVNFGDPHIEIYCAAIVRGELGFAEWTQAVHGRQDRNAAARECAARLRRQG